MIENFFFSIGSVVLKVFDLIIGTLGRFSIFQLEVLKLFFKKPFRIKETLLQIEIIGMNAFLVIFLTAFLMGIVEAVE